MRLPFVLLAILPFVCTTVTARDPVRDWLNFSGKVRLRGSRTKIEETLAPFKYTGSTSSILHNLFGPSKVQDSALDGVWSDENSVEEPIASSHNGLNFVKAIHS